jgi:ADP-ribose pyrophosphatase
MASKGEGSVRILGEGRFLRLMDRDTWEHVERIRVSGVVCMVAVTPENALLLVEQYRPALRSATIEIPAGLVGDLPGTENEAFETAATRELEEETGYTAARMRFLSEGPTSSGICSETIRFYRAEGLRKIGDGGGDHSEDITVHVVPLQGIHDWLETQTQRGVLIDPKVYAGLYFVGQGAPG